MEGDCLGNGRILPLQLLATDGHGQTRLFFRAHPCSSDAARLVGGQTADHTGSWQRTDTAIFRAHPCSSDAARFVGRQNADHTGSWQRTDTVFFRAHPCSSDAARFAGGQNADHTGSWQRTDTVIFRAHPCSSNAALTIVSHRFNCSTLYPASRSILTTPSGPVKWPAPKTKSVGISFMAPMMIGIHSLLRLP